MNYNPHFQNKIENRYSGFSIIQTPSTIAISSSVNPYNPYTKASTSASNALVSDGGRIVSGEDAGDEGDNFSF
ncbi:MAG: hypothetical protein IPH31_15640 [Lewinellaceae bacterium]|nr:hypothetical protein [Lewinellaceae bacterium]